MYVNVHTHTGCPKKNALSECCWSHSALAQSQVAGTPCVRNLIFSISSIFGTPCIFKPFDIPLSDLQSSALSAISTGAPQARFDFFKTSKTFNTSKFRSVATFPFYLVDNSLVLRLRKPFSVWKRIATHSFSFSLLLLLFLQPSFPVSISYSITLSSSFSSTKLPFSCFSTTFVIRFHLCFSDCKLFSQCSEVCLSFYSLTQCRFDYGPQQQ